MVLILIKITTMKAIGAGHVDSGGQNATPVTLPGARQSADLSITRPVAKKTRQYVTPYKMDAVVYMLFRLSP